MEKQSPEFMFTVKLEKKQLYKDMHLRLLRTSSWIYRKTYLLPKLYNPNFTLCQWKGMQNPNSFSYRKLVTL